MDKKINFKINSIRNIDYKLSKSIYDTFDNKNLNYIPFYLGLIPYEIYVLPGMYLAILQTIWLGTPNPTQFHLLPHFFAYSVFQLLKSSIKTPRPGCFFKSMKKYINKGHCLNGNEFKSFPSGHCGIAASLSVALFMEMMYSENSYFFEINIKDIKRKRLIVTIGFFVTFMILVHRVSKGYHSLLDSIIAILIGGSIGFFSWTTIEYFKKKYYNICKKDNNCDKPYNNDIFNLIKNYDFFKLEIYDDLFINKITGITRIILTITIVFLIFKFITVDIFKLSSIKH